jgi:hypothetical protein
VALVPLHCYNYSFLVLCVSRTQSDSAFFDCPKRVLSDPAASNGDIVVVLLQRCRRTLVSCIFQVVAINCIFDSQFVSGMYMASLMSLVALSLMMTVIVLNIHFKQSFGNRVPPWMRTVFIHYLGICFGRKWRKTSYKATNIKCKV